MPPATLSRDDWVRAAVDELFRAGPDAVAVQPLARLLGATKGSFYWHFDGRDDLLAEALAGWVDRSTDAVVRRVRESGRDPRGRVLLLFDLVTDAATRHRGELLVLAGVHHPLVADAVGRATRRRVAYVAELLEAAGVAEKEAGRRALLSYATYLGFAQLAAAAPGVLPDAGEERRLLIDEMTVIITG